MTVAIREVVSASDKVLRQMQALYERSFPPAERRPFEHVRRMLDVERPHCGIHLLAGLDGDGLLGLSIFRYLPQASLGYLWYLCVAESARGMGLGGRLYGETLDVLRRDAELFRTGLRGLVFEVERPSAEPDPAYGDPIRRVRFYERLGARLLFGYDYWQPAIPPYGPVPLQLMFHPLDLGLRECTPAVLSRVISDFRLHAQGVEETLDPSDLRLGR